jgi:hypothetical protein
MRRMRADLKIEGMAIRYSQFVPRLYNSASRSASSNRMMPSRAFCSDESQGYPTILVAQHFGTFPFDHETEARQKQAGTLLLLQCLLILRHGWLS